jgi:hypothetical protein
LTDHSSASECILKIGAQSANPDMACQSHKLVSAGEHVVERSEGIRVVAIEAFALDPLEHVSEIDIAGTRLQMNFVAVTKTIGKAHLFDPAHVERVDEAGDPRRYKMRVIDGKRQFERR